uniref:Uncharacterized protein n=1 Tax=Anguilla anguilla TaxID=7936 RepID=A0A0E9XAH9_ANGAN
MSYHCSIETITSYLAGSISSITRSNTIACFSQG